MTAAISPYHTALLSPQPLFRDYSIPAGVYDEAFAAPGVLRPHWMPVVQALETLDGLELDRRWQQARQMLYEHGVTYNIHSDAEDTERPWELDAIPLVLTEGEWRGLEAALIQRARLLNTLLADVYGPQRLLRAGVLPAELVLAHDNFLRACHQLPVPNGCYLHLYAVDLARTPDGQWRVLADRAQSPAGAGYALENRLILGRTFPDLLRQVQIQRLAAFFATLRETLHALAPHHHDNPRIVVLTPGPSDETYFEHAYLARYLGYTLVEGGDLTVRDQSVYLKTLAGLQPVDVILRRQNDALCDPLALRQDSGLGVSGLVQAVRAGNVAVANALGSGWLDTTALMAFLPSLCQHLFGETLQLPSIDTWWCGQPEALTYVLDHLDSLVVGPAVFAGARHPRTGMQLSHTARQRLMVRLRARPYAYMAQALQPLSTVPVWNGNRLQPGSTVLRAYAVATADGYVVMPGGLTRVATTPDTYLTSLLQGDGSKDTWVLSSTPPGTFSLLPASDQPLVLRRSGNDLQSRVADNLLWLGRYAERIEGAVRLLRSVLRRLTYASHSGDHVALPTVLQAVAKVWELAPTTFKQEGELVAVHLERPLLDVMFNPRFPGSIRAMLSSLHGLAAIVRDRISTDAWRIITRLHQEFTPPHPESLIPLSDALGLLNQTLITLAAFSGLGVENMTRGPGWHFLDMGRRLERAMSTLTLLHSTCVAPSSDEGAVLEMVLEIADSSMTYRSRYLTTLQMIPVLDLLLTDDSNPRSVLYQLDVLAEHVAYLSRDTTQPALSQAQRLALMALMSLKLAELDTLCSRDANGQRAQLAGLLQQLRQYLPALAETITQQYLSHAEVSRHLAIRQQTSPA